jgi:hypothetical protein
MLRNLAISALLGFGVCNAFMAAAKILALLSRKFLSICIDNNYEHYAHHRHNFPFSRYSPLFYW